MATLKKYLFCSLYTKKNEVTTLFFFIQAEGLVCNHYPSKDILKLILTYGGRIMLNSDCHNKEKLDYGLDFAKNLAKEVGFTKQVILTKKGFTEIDL